MEVRQGSGIKRIVKRLERGKDLFVESNELDQYRGFVIAQIDANKDTIEFINGYVLGAGNATGDITEMAIRPIQIREAIKAHLEKEQILFAQGIKVLSLFFIAEAIRKEEGITMASRRTLVPCAADAGRWISKMRTMQ